MRWMREIRARFAGRAELSAAELAVEFACGGEPDEEETVRCLEIFDEEYEIRPGLLRAADPMTIFTDPPSTNPLTWLWVRYAYEEGLSELSYHLNRTRKKRGLEDVYPEPTTIGEYVCLFRGMEPGTPSGNRGRTGPG